MVPCTSTPIGVGSTLDNFQYVAGCMNNATDRIKFMLGEEDEFVTGDYIANVQVDGMDRHWRKRIAGWFFQLAGNYNFSRETALLAISILDRYLATASVTFDEYHLACLSCLHIAIKYCERVQPKMRHILALANGQFTPKHMRNMEQKVLENMGLRINYPTPSSFARAMLTYLKVSKETMEEILEGVQYLIELATCGECRLLLSSMDSTYLPLTTCSMRMQLLILSLCPICFNNTPTDYNAFVTQKPSCIAFGSIVSVFKRVGVMIPEEEKAAFLFTLKMRFNLGESNPDVVVFRGRLDRICYSAQQAIEPVNNTNERKSPVSSDKDGVEKENSNPSPNSVDMGVNLSRRKIALMRSQDAEDALNDRPQKRSKVSSF